MIVDAVQVHFVMFRATVQRVTKDRPQSKYIGYHFVTSMFDGNHGNPI